VLITVPFLQIEATGIDLSVTMDLAAGHGRNAAKLLPMAGRLHIVDIHASNVGICRARFGEDPRIAYHDTDGCTLPVPDAALSFLFCFDAMVHFDSDVVRAYLAEARRVMAPGARAFLHHSNHTGGEDWLLAPHCRNFMSQPLFAHYARKEGLTVLQQVVMDWGGVSGLDCLSLLRRD